MTNTHQIMLFISQHSVSILCFGFIIAILETIANYKLERHLCKLKNKAYKGEKE